MADELKTYYERYKETMGKDAYTMENTGGSSRVLFLQEFVRKYAPLGGTILDVGCGDMYLSKVLPAYKWTGIDIAPNMSNDKAMKVDLMAPPYPFPAESFDVALCSEVLEHLFDLRVVNHEVARLLKPGGTFIMSTPNFDYIDHQLMGFKQLLFDANKVWLFEHIRQYNFDVHDKYLQEAGFDPLEVVGADAHYSSFFEYARIALKSLIRYEHKKELTDGEIDRMLGLMFPRHNHTIMIVSQKKETV